MNSNKNITQITEGAQITINKHGEVITATFKNYREITVRTRTATFEIHTDKGMIWAGFKGEAVHYNDYSTSIVSM